MARKIKETDLTPVLDAIKKRGGTASLAEIAEDLAQELSDRTLRFRLGRLSELRRIVKNGKGRWVRYSLPPITLHAGGATPVTPVTQFKHLTLSLSPESIAIREYLSQPVTARKPVGYNRDFLDSYRPNVSFYLSETERNQLAEIGNSHFATEAAGTYAKQVYSRLLIDLSWNSSRLEGNTYSLLDTKRLIEFGQEPEGSDQMEAQMILNHKDAIAFLVSSADEIGFNRYTILNLHAMLAHNLLRDESAAGRLRTIPVGIDKSTFHPLEIPQLIEESFDQILATATAIQDPFEQAFFFMVQMPYLQPFDDVNKRVSRLGANIPFIKRNLSPLSFIDVPRTDYTNAVLGVYELNKVDLLRDVFIWAYKRSAEQYAAVRQSLGAPDPFRQKHDRSLKQIISEIIAGRMTRSAAGKYILSWARKNISREDRERFRELAEGDLLKVHEGNFARYQVRPSEFAAWKAVWAGEPSA